MVKRTKKNSKKYGGTGNVKIEIQDFPFWKIENGEVKYPLTFTGLRRVNTISDYLLKEVELSNYTGWACTLDFKELLLLGTNWNDEIVPYLIRHGLARYH